MGVGGAKGTRKAAPKSKAIARSHYYFQAYRSKGQDGGREIYGSAVGALAELWPWKVKLMTELAGFT